MRGAILAAVVAVLATGHPPTAVAAEPTVANPNASVNQRGSGQFIEDFNSPSVAVNPRDPMNIVVASRFDTPDFMCQNTTRSTVVERGDHPASRRPPVEPVGLPALPSMTPTASTSPRRTVRGAGAARTSSSGHRRTGVEASPMRSPSPGSGFQASIAVDTSRTTHPNGPVVYVTSYNFPNFPSSIDTLLSFSEDGGATWSAPASKPVVGEYQQLAQPAVAPDGTLYIVYKDTNNFAPTTATSFAVDCPTSFNRVTRGECPIRVARSSDGGRTFDSAGPNGEACLT